MNRSKLIYGKNWVRQKTLYYLESCPQLNSIIFLTTINDLFNNFKDIFGKFYQKKHVMGKFRVYKRRANSFTNFCAKFIELTSDLGYTSKMLIREFKHKVTTGLQDWFISGVELYVSTLALAKCCLSIYKQMQAIDRIRNKTKP